MAKLQPITRNEKVVAYAFYCPGCKGAHSFNVHGDRSGDGPKWDFDGNLEKPTFTPSLIVFYEPKVAKCHLFMRDGKIQFLGDCKHDLAGQTVEVPDWNGIWVKDDG